MVFNGEGELAPPHEPTADEDSRVIPQVKDEQISFLRLEGNEICTLKARHQIPEQYGGFSNRVYPHSIQGLSLDRDAITAPKDLWIGFGLEAIVYEEGPILGGLQV